MSFPDGTEFYLDDAAERTDSTATFDTAFLYPSSGSHFNSKANPELFDSENYFYKGEYAPVGEYTPVKAGDTFGSLTITSAKYSVYLYYPEGSTKPEAETLDNVVTLDGELTLSGIMYFYYDDDYTISAGDIHFIPDSSYEGLPMPLLSDGYGGYTSECTTMNFGEIVGGISCYSDAPEIRLGNLFADYADNAELNAFLDGGSAYCAKFAEITISDVQLEYSEQFGLRGLAKLVSVSEQK